MIESKNAQIVDVREPMEYAMGHVNGAKNIPLSSLPARVSYFKSSDQPFVLYCASGNRSGQATQFLKAHGLTAVYNAGGIGEIRTCVN